MTLAVAFLDANVLYLAPLRDLLPRLAFAGLYRARWPAEIDDEWERDLLAARAEQAERIDRTQAAMHKAIPDAPVTDYTHLIPNLSLLDRNDRYVLAAAEVIVTFNRKDFPAAALASHGLVARHPDAFLRSLFTAMPFQVLAVVGECVSRLTYPLVASSGYLKMSRRLGLTETAAFLESILDDRRP